MDIVKHICIVLLKPLTLEVCNIEIQEIRAWKRKMVSWEPESGQMKEIIKKYCIDIHNENDI